MKFNKGQTTLEFMLVFVVLLIATTGVFTLYKQYWKQRYEKASFAGSIAGSVVGKVNSDYSYVK